MLEKKTKLFVYLSSTNAEWLDLAVASFKRDRQRTNRSELVDIAVSLLKSKNQNEIKKILQKPTRETYKRNTTPG